MTSSLVSHSGTAPPGALGCYTVAAGFLGSDRSHALFLQICIFDIHRSYRSHRYLYCIIFAYLFVWGSPPPPHDSDCSCKVEPAANDLCRGAQKRHAKSKGETPVEFCTIRHLSRPRHWSGERGAHDRWIQTAIDRDVLHFVSCLQGQRLVHQIHLTLVQTRKQTQSHLHH